MMMMSSNEEETFRKQLGAESTAMAEHLYPRSVAIVLHDANDVPVSVGSGTCVRIADRYFIATAAHVLDGVARFRDIAIVALVGDVGRVSNQTPNVVGVGRRGGKKVDPVDVAWIEIEPKAIVSWTATWGRAFVTLDRIRIEPVPEGAHAYVFGQPAEYLNPNCTFQGKPLLGLSALPFLTATIPTPEGCQPEDLYVHYPNAMNTAEGAKALPVAEGLSGCGIWVVNPREGGVWTPDRAQLAAVEGSWFEFEWLRGTPMREWLRLVRDDIPELAAEIDPLLNRPA